MKIVIDSNVIISAFATHGLCNELFELCLAEHDIYLCDKIIAEIRKALIYKIKAPDKTETEVIEYITACAKKAKPAEVDKKVCRDERDLMVLGIAESVKADVILTGDKDLLVIGKYKHTKILSPADFWKLLKNK